jgi:predicted nucleic acid-binding protein
LTVVIDTNVLAALMLPTASSIDVAAQLRRDPDWRVPPLWRSEFRHVLLKHVRAGLLQPDQAIAVWHKALERLELCEHPVVGQQVLDLAIRHGCSSYDAEFVVLAQQLNCPLLTFDRKLLELFPAVALKPGP